MRWQPWCSSSGERRTVPPRGAHEADVGLVLRVFLVEAGTLTRVPVGRFVRFDAGDPAARFPEYAGRRLQCAMAYVEMQDRRPVAVRHVDYSVISVDRDGRLDVERRDKQERLAVESVELLPDDPVENVVGIERYIARRQYRRDFTWTPTQAEKDAVLLAALR